MSIRTRLALPLAACAVAFAGPPASADAPSPVRLRLDGIGPLKLGMSRTAALATGWLSNRGTGCKLGGPPFAITYRLRGAKAPAGLRGSVEFNRGKLTDMAFTRGVRTVTGVTVGVTTASRMAARYRSAGFSATAAFDNTFQGTFVRVMRGGKDVLGAFADKSVIDTLAIPRVSVCE